MKRPLEILTAFLLAACVVWAAVTIRRALVLAAATPLQFSMQTQSPGISPTTGLPNPGPYTFTAKPINGAAPYTCILTAGNFPVQLNPHPAVGNLGTDVIALPFSATVNTSLTIKCVDSNAPQQIVTLTLTLEPK